MIDLEHFRAKGYLTGLEAFRPGERSAPARGVPAPAGAAAAGGAGGPHGLVARPRPGALGDLPRPPHPRLGGGDPGPRLLPLGIAVLLQGPRGRPHRALAPGRLLLAAVAAPVADRLAGGVGRRRGERRHAGAARDPPGKAPPRGNRPGRGCPRLRHRPRGDRPLRSRIAGARGRAGEHSRRPHRPRLRTEPVGAAPPGADDPVFGRGSEVRHLGLAFLQGFLVPRTATAGATTRQGRRRRPT